MSRISRLSSVVFSLVALGAVLISASQQAEAQVKAFRIRGEGRAPKGLPLPGQEARPHWIIGNATHLGRHEGNGTVKTATADLSELPERITGKFGSGKPFTFVAANGDKLVCTYGRGPQGQFTGDYTLTVVGQTSGGDLIVKANFIAEFVPLSRKSTGRFSGITGSWTMFAWTEPFVLASRNPLDYQWAGSGMLKFRKGGRKR